MEVKQAKRPMKVRFVSQRDIVQKNRSRREHVLRILDQIREAQQEVAAAVETSQRR